MKCIIIFVLFLISCQKKEVGSQDPVPCPQVQSLGSTQSLPLSFSYLHMDPFYIEMRAFWQAASLPLGYTFSGFKLSDRSTGVLAEITLSGPMASNASVKCQQQISSQGLALLKDLINHARICPSQSVVGTQGTCGPPMAALFLPASLYLVDQARSVTVGLSTYAMDSSISFCDQQDVESIQKNIETLFDFTNLGACEPIGP